MKASTYRSVRDKQLAAPTTSAWPTVFLVNETEIKPPHPFPAFTVGGEIMLYRQDAYSEASAERVPEFFRVTRVIFDVYTPKQYVYLVRQ